MRKNNDVSSKGYSPSRLTFVIFQSQIKDVFLHVLLKFFCLFILRQFFKPVSNIVLYLKGLPCSCAHVLYEWGYN